MYYPVNTNFKVFGNIELWSSIALSFSAVDEVVDWVKKEATNEHGKVVVEQNNDIDASFQGIQIKALYLNAADVIPPEPGTFSLVRPSYSHRRQSASVNINLPYFH